MSLSSKFSQINAAKVITPKTIKRNVVIEGQKQNRVSQIQNKRGLAPVARDNNRKPNNGTKRVPAKGGKLIQGKRVAGKNAKIGKKPMNNRRNNKKEAVKEEDLDKELGMYLHKAGRGPNPVEAELDNELDNYKSAQQKQATA